MAGKKYQDGSLEPKPTDAHLPCEKACPPADATTTELRRVLLSWCHEDEMPAKTILCVPSKGTEAWVIAALLPEDPALKSEIECYPDPEKRLGQQKKSLRFEKSRRSYLDRQDQMERRWAGIVATESNLTEARRFQKDVLAALSPKMDSVDGPV